MGTRQRPRPEKLPEKLRIVRERLGLSQNEIVEALGEKGEMFRSTISAFERGTREPSLLILLRYARLIGVSTDILIDDEMDLR